ncbi:MULTISPECIES: acyltransferase [Tepidicaulis]|nr:acyltransferase [Tepidicaulis marinus]
MTAGKNLHIRSARGHMVRLSTWDTGTRQGRIEIGDNVLISPSNQIVSSVGITIGSNTMLASGCYISDSDWHDTYDRTAEHEKYAPVVLKDNVWLGVRTIVGKGVTIGENSIIGAGSVVMTDIPANVIAVGNPAKPVRELDMTREFRKREELFHNPEKLARDMDQLQRYLLRENTFLNWLRILVAPRRGD